jgi:arylformamidase
MAESFVKAGAHLARVQFDGVNRNGGDLLPLVKQCRRAVGWIYANAETIGVDRSRIYLCGHSSGGHLGGCVLMSDWAREALPLNPIKGAILGSGMYDLKAVRLSKRSAFVTITDETEQALSPQRHPDKFVTPLVLTYGTLETPEFQRQTRDFAAALTAAGKPVRLLAGKGFNHFETMESLRNPYGFMGRAALEMMELAA